MKKRTVIRTAVATALVAVVSVGVTLFGSASSGASALSARGGGTTIVRGGTGDPSFAPVITTFAFSWRDGKGGFECLALTPSAAAGDPGSGKFDVNAMYVTGAIASAVVDDGTLVLKGTATVTGLGAGSHRAFTARATPGGPGATLTLDISGLKFREIVTDGEIRF